jgi:putative PIN family toxin of toxin-antitoxin system
LIRAYLDTNLYISFLLKPRGSGPPSAIVRAGLQGTFTFLISDPTIDEILHKTASKPSLSRHITRSQVDALLDVIELAGEHVRSAPSVIPAISRDRKDDYLVTYSIAGNATHLVTGDKDLPEHGQDFGFEIVTPAQFVAMLDAEKNPN